MLQAGLDLFRHDVEARFGVTDAGSVVAVAAGLLAADPVDGAPVRHGHDPGGRAAACGVEAWCAAPHLQQHFLGHFLGLRGIPENAADQP